LFEDRDIDCVARWIDRDTLHYCAVQLKELVPAHVNAGADIMAELAKLSKYADARDLVVAFYVNREVLPPKSASLRCGSMVQPRLTDGTGCCMAMYCQRQRAMNFSIRANLLCRQGASTLLTQHVRRPHQM
jgi:hypothetical protein